MNLIHFEVCWYCSLVSST